MDKEKAKERAWIQHCRLFHPGETDAPVVEKSAINSGFDAASAQPATEWVDVSERLPEADNVEFWWTRKESNTVEKRTFWKCNSEYYLKEFSAWMPFHKRPEPFTPKETTV